MQLKLRQFVLGLVWLWKRNVVGHLAPRRQDLRLFCLVDELTKVVEALHQVLRTEIVFLLDHVQRRSGLPVIIVVA